MTQPIFESPAYRIRGGRSNYSANILGLGLDFVRKVEYNEETICFSLLSSSAAGVRKSLDVLFTIFFECVNVPR